MRFAVQYNDDHCSIGLLSADVSYLVLYGGKLCCTVLFQCNSVSSMHLQYLAMFSVLTRKDVKSEVVIWLLREATVTQTLTDKVHATSYFTGS